MSFLVKKAGGLEYLACREIHTPHGFSTRLGGVSQGDLSSLNLGMNRGDDPENVRENYRRFGSAVGFDPEDLVFAVQKHTNLVAKVTRENRGEGLTRPAPGPRDGLITNEKGVALTIFSADCTPVLFYDPVKQAVGGAHAGWRGTASGIVKNVVEAMRSAYGSRPEDIVAAIGPCIGQCCFETDADVAEAMVGALGKEAETAITPKGQKFFVDLKRLNAMWLRAAGVQRVEICGDCTHCQPQRFWSHRATQGRRGSLANIIMLK